jgi:hypothetical protein
LIRNGDNSGQDDRDYKRKYKRKSTALKHVDTPSRAKILYRVSPVKTQQTRGMNCPGKMPHNATSGHLASDGMDACRVFGLRIQRSFISVLLLINKNCPRWGKGFYKVLAISRERCKSPVRLCSESLATQQSVFSSGMAEHQKKGPNRCRYSECRREQHQYDPSA